METLKEAENGDLYEYGDSGDGATGPVPLEEGGGDDADGLPRGQAVGGIHLAGGGTNPQGGRRLLGHWTGGGGVEGGDSNSQFLSYHLH